MKRLPFDLRPYEIAPLTSHEHGPYVPFNERQSGRFRSAASHPAGASAGWVFGKGLKVIAIRKAPMPMAQEPI